MIGTVEKIGSVLGQDQDNFVMVPLSNFLRMQGAHTSLTINVKTTPANFEIAQDQAQLTVRARHHLGPRRRTISSLAPKKATWRCGAASVRHFLRYLLW